LKREFIQKLDRGDVIALTCIRARTSSNEIHCGVRISNAYSLCPGNTSGHIKYECLKKPSFLEYRPCEKGKHRSLTIDKTNMGENVVEKKIGKMASMRYYGLNGL
jgi:hypothetical protein